MISNDYARLWNSIAAILLRLRMILERRIAKVLKYFEWSWNNWFPCAFWSMECVCTAGQDTLLRTEILLQSRRLKSLYNGEVWVWEKKVSYRISFQYHIFSAWLDQVWKETKSSQFSSQSCAKCLPFWKFYDVLIRYWQTWQALKNIALSTYQSGQEESRYTPVELFFFKYAEIQETALSHMSFSGPCYTELSRHSPS